MGYQEISGDCLDEPTKPPKGGERNAAFRVWLIECYGVTIPAAAADILGAISDVLADTSDDSFHRWVCAKQDGRS